MKTYNETMIIEQADNGITVRNKFEDHDETFNVVLRENEALTIGKEIFESVRSIMDEECRNVVRMKITYETID